MEEVFPHGSSAAGRGWIPLQIYQFLLNPLGRHRNLGQFVVSVSLEVSNSGEVKRQTEETLILYWKQNPHSQERGGGKNRVTLSVGYARPERNPNPDPDTDPEPNLQETKP